MSDECMTKTPQDKGTMSRPNSKLAAETLMQSVVFAITLAVLCRVFGFGRGVLLARSLDSMELGRWALLSNAVDIVAFVLLLGVPAGLSRYVGRHQERGDLLPFLCRIALVVAGFAMVAVAIGLTFPDATGRLLFGETGSNTLVWLVLASVCATVAFSVLQGILYGMRLLRWNSMLELAQNLGFLILLLLLVVFGRDDVFAAGSAHLAMTALATCVIGIVLVYRLRGSRPAIEPTEIRSDHDGKGILGSGIWVLFFFSIGSWSFGSLQRMCRGLDRYMLLHFGDMQANEALHQIGDYFLTLKLCEPIGMLAGALACVLLPHAAIEYERGKHEKTSRRILLTAKLTMLAMALGGCVLILLKSTAFTILLGHEPRVASLVLAPVLVSTIVVAYHTIIRTHLLCVEKAWSVAGIWLIALLLNAGLNAYLVPRHQLLGAVVATMLSSFAVLALVLVLSHRSGLKMDRGTILASLLPAALLLPIGYAVVTILGVIVLSATTSLLFTTDDRQFVAHWVVAKINRSPLSRRLAPLAKWIPAVETKARNMASSPKPTRG